MGGMICISAMYIWCRIRSRSVIRYSLVQIDNVIEVGKSTDVISIGVARKPEGTIVLKEIVVVFIVLRDCVWSFGMVHRYVREMTTVYKVTELGKMFVPFRVVCRHFVMICGVNPRSKLPNAIESATRNGYLLLASSEKEPTTTTDNELKHRHL